MKRIILATLVAAHLVAFEAHAHNEYFFHQIR